MSGVVPHYRDALKLKPTVRLALVVTAGRLRGDVGKWDWYNREWIKPSR